MTPRPRPIFIPCEVLQWHGENGLRVRTISDFPLAPWGIDALIPAGYISDGMSVPRFLWPLLGASIDSKTLGPSIAHDYLYDTHLVSRCDADTWYVSQLAHTGYGHLRTAAVWIGLRLAGASHW